MEALGTLNFESYHRQREKNIIMSEIHLFYSDDNLVGNKKNVQSNAKIL